MTTYILKKMESSSPAINCHTDAYGDSVRLLALLAKIELELCIPNSLLKRFMPPRWPREPDRRDPEYRRLDDRMNFAMHVAIFAACNSGLWFFHNLQAATWPWATWVTGGWALVLFAHAVYIFAIADYSDPVAESLGTTPVGFQPKPKQKSKKTTRG